MSTELEAESGVSIPQLEASASTPRTAPAAPEPTSTDPSCTASSRASSSPRGCTAEGGCPQSSARGAEGECWDPKPRTACSAARRQWRVAPCVWQAGTLAAAAGESAAIAHDARRARRGKQRRPRAAACRSVHAATRAPAPAASPGHSTSERAPAIAHAVRAEMAATSAAPRAIARRPPPCEKRRWVRYAGTEVRHGCMHRIAQRKTCILAYLFIGYFHLRVVLGSGLALEKMGKPSTSLQNTAFSISGPGVARKP